MINDIDSVKINDCSNIGFGSYRVSHANRQHRRALKLAIKLGCNLIDTASNYTNGESEKLIGQFISENPEKKLFVITKGGYIQGNTINKVNSSNFKNDLKNYTKINDNLHHSIDPLFLQSQISQSLYRLNRRNIDGYLLHNPEYFYKSEPKNPEIIYDHIKESFEFLEDMVQMGRIRYYGVSSNTLALSKKPTLNIRKLIEIAKSVSSQNHFRFIQIPYNIYENEAKRGFIDGDNVIGIAHKNNIKVLGNRPLNAMNEGSPVRLALYSKEISALNPRKDKKLFESFIEMVKSEFLKNNVEYNQEEIPILDHLKSNWMNIGNPEAVHVLFNNHLLPLIEALCDGDITQDFKLIYEELRNRAILYSKKLITIKALEIEESLIRNNIIARDSKSLSLRLIETYLNDGIDHVLVGCRSEEYVKNVLV